jgi:hypothetical protein
MIKVKKKFLGIETVKLNTKKFRVNLKSNITLFLTTKQKALNPNFKYYYSPFEIDPVYRSHNDSDIIKTDCGTLIYRNGVGSVTYSETKNTHEAKFNKYEVTTTTLFLFKDKEIIYEKIS